MFSDAQIHAANLNKRIPRLRRKNLGGRAGRAGVKYEDYVVAAKVIRAAPIVLERAAVRFGIREQPSNCFVDDLVVHRNGKSYFYQLKSGNRVSWSKVLVRDFEDQSALCNAVGMQCRLRLVVGDIQQYRILSGSMPAVLRQQTRVEFFPRITGLSQLAGSTPALRRALLRSCALERPEESDLDIVARAIYNACEDRIHSNGAEVSAADIIAHAGTDPNTMIRRSGVPLPPEWNVAEPVIAAIPGLAVRLQDGVFEYSYGVTDRGRARVDSTAFRRALVRIINNRPTTFEDFEVQL